MFSFLRRSRPTPNEEILSPDTISEVHQELVRQNAPRLQEMADLARGGHIMDARFDDETGVVRVMVGTPDGNLYSWTWVTATPRDAQELAAAVRLDPNPVFVRSSALGEEALIVIVQTLSWNLYVPVVGVVV